MPPPLLLSSAQGLSPCLCLSIALILASSLMTWAEEINSQSHNSRYELLGLSAQPASLESGQSSGFAASYSYALSPATEGGLSIRLGVLLSYEELSENSLAWSVDHHMTRLSLEQESAWNMGRGSFGLAFGIAGLQIFENQSRLQAGRLAQEGRGSVASELILSRQAQLSLFELNLTPTTRLKLIEGSWGTLGLSGRFMLAYHPFQSKLPSTLSPLTWGALFGFYLSPSSRSEVQGDER